MREKEFSDQELDTHDFLGGKLQIRQPRAGYRSGSDTVLLAASCTVRAGQSVLELGCGAGVASFCLAQRAPGVVLHGLELQPGYAALARANADRLGVALTVHEGVVERPPKDLRALTFDHVIANPPYFDANASTATEDDGKDGAFRTDISLADWVDCGLRRLREGGWLTIIHRAERLPDLLSALQTRAGDIRIKPLASRTGHTASRIIVRARKGSRAPLSLCAPLILHDGERHERDEISYSPAAQAVLRDGLALDF